MTTWDKDGNRTDMMEPFKPYLYVKGQGDRISIYEDRLRKLEFKTIMERREYAESNKHTFYNLPVLQQYLIDKFGGHESDNDFSRFPLSIYFIDIEVFAPDGFPNAMEALDQIVVITVYSTLEQTFHVFGVGVDYYTVSDDVKYHYFPDEESMIKGFIRWWRKDFPDIVSGWYSFGFDMPYLCNRINRIYGDDKACSRLSPCGKVRCFENAKRRFGAVERIYDQLWTIDGVTHIDMQAAYYKFSPKKLESYSLNSVCAEEGLGQKIEHSGSLSDWWLKDPQEFIDYNIQDVRLLVKLEDKLKYMQLCRHMAYSALAPLGDALGTIPIVTGLVALEALSRDRIISSYDNSDAVVEFEGGYVADPKVGFASGIVSIDANSLYPSVIRTLNISNETKLGWFGKTEDGKFTIKLINGKTAVCDKPAFVNFIKRNKIAISPSMVMFSQTKKGILPSLVERLYNTRKQTKKEMLATEKQIADIEAVKPDDPRLGEMKAKAEFLNIRQWLAKIQLNSIYGAMSEKHYALFDLDLSKSVTAMGRETIKYTAKLVNDRASQLCGEEVDVGLYSDTDSVAGDTIITVNGRPITIADYYESIDEIPIVDIRDGKTKVVLNGDVAKCFNGKFIENREVNYVMKHTIRKQMFKITTGNNTIIVTSDHSLVIHRNNTYVSVKPKEIKPGDELILCEKQIKMVYNFSVEDLGVREETVYDIEVDGIHNFFANDILVHNSRYFTIAPILKAQGSSFTNRDGTITDQARRVAEDIANYADRGIAEWHREKWNCLNPAVGFKREVLAPEGVFVAPKMYALHVLDDEGVPCDKITYHGLAVVRSSTPAAVKPMIKDLMDTLIKTQSRNIVIDKAIKYWEQYQRMPVYEKAVTIGLNNINKFGQMATRGKDGYLIPAKSTPRQVVCALRYNDMLSIFGLKNKYTSLKEGDKMKLMYIKPNKFGLNSFGYYDVIPNEFKNDIVIDDAKMFMKTVWSCIDGCFERVGWQPFNPTTGELDLFGMLTS